MPDTDLQKLSDLLGRRDSDALYFKPLCVYAACELIEEGKLPAHRIDVPLVLDRFDELILPLIPGAKGEGYQPFWHLGTPGFWRPYSRTGELVVGAIFTSRNKPRSRKQLEDAVCYAVPSNQAAASLSNSDKRQSLMRSLIDLLESDDDISCQAVAVVLEERLNPEETTAKSRHKVTQQAEEYPEYTTEDYRKLRVHKRVDRSSSKKVKAVLGYVCQMCSVDLEKVYGPVGRGYIEAHHLRPVSDSVGQRITLDIRKDFVVLCANCHRMIHRAKLPHSIDAYVQAHGKPRVQV